MNDSNNDMIKHILSEGETITDERLVNLVYQNGNLTVENHDLKNKLKLANKEILEIIYWLDKREMSDTAISVRNTLTKLYHEVRINE